MKVTRRSYIAFTLLAGALSACSAGNESLDEGDDDGEVSGETEQGAGADVMAWTRWETSLLSTKSYSNPYKQVTVTVTFTGPDGTHTTRAFWDGNDANGKHLFRVRSMFSVPGTYSWQTTCSDTSNTGLHARSGTIAVTPYSGNNVLYKRGYPKVSGNKRFLTYGDGSPFLWMGDTAWGAPRAALPSEWESYIDKRKAQHFNVIQVHTGGGWSGLSKDPSGNAPFLGTGSTLRWNPAYWQRVDEMVEYANTQGMLVFFAAVRQPGVPENDVTEVRRFARSLASRLNGNFVVYSPVADDVSSTMADEVGDELSASTSMQLVTAHPRFKWDPAVEFHDKQYTDFAGLQSGAGWQHDPYLNEPGKPFSASLASRQAIEWPLALSQRAPKKPVLALELPYDGKALQQGSDPARYSPPYPARLVRSTAYLSMLSGAAGATYGCSDVWSWGQHIKFDGVDWDPANVAHNRQLGIDQASAVHMKYWYELFSGISWSKLVPRHALVKNQPADWLKKMVVARTGNGKLAVAYLPDNASITLNMSEFTGPMQAKWFNPLTGTWITESAKVSTGSDHTFSRPAGWDDAVLLLQTAN